MTIKLKKMANNTLYNYKKELTERLLQDYEVDIEQLGIHRDCIRNNFSFGLSVQGFLFALEEEYGIVSKQMYNLRKKQLV